MAITPAGTTFAISAASPATQDAAGYNALTFTEVVDIDQIGQIGASFEKVEFQPLKGPKQKLKGPADYGALTPSYATSTTDAGQTLMMTAGNDTTNKLYSAKVTYPDGTKEFCQGRVFGTPKTVGAANSVLMVNPTFEVCTIIVSAPAT